MKIALVTAFPRKPESPRGGVEAVSVNLVKALAQVPSNVVHVVTTSPETDRPERTEWAGATIHRLPRGQQKLLPYAVGPGRRQVRVFLLGLQPDVVHAHDTYGIMVKGLPLPRVFTIHGFIHEDTRYEGGWTARARARLWRWIEVSAWRDQPHIISISPYVRERLRGLVRGTVHDIENPIAPESFGVQSRLEQPVVFSAAALCARKNTLGLLAGFQGVVARDGSAKLRLAGPVVEPGYGEAVQAYLKEHRLDGAVTLLGSLPASEVRREYAAARVFALVSLEEGAPMGIAEAMAAGLPVVTSNRCGMPYMVRDGETGFLVDPTRPEDIERGLARILFAPELAREMGNKARAMARERFHPDRVAERTMRVYAEAVASARSGRG